jgi:hypothetical protein
MPYPKRECGLKNNSDTLYGIKEPRQEERPF